MAQSTRFADGRLALSRPRLDEIAREQPELAYEILRASAPVMAERMRGTLERGTRSPRRVGGLRRRAPGGAHGW